jgi:hypothetical protein
MSLRVFLVLIGISMLLGLSACACDDIMDYCPTNIWVKPV